MSAGVIAGMVIQEAKGCDVVSEAVLNETYYSGYMDGYIAAVQDMAGEDIANVICGLNETITIQIDGREFRLVCEG